MMHGSTNIKSRFPIPNNSLQGSLPEDLQINRKIHKICRYWNVAETKFIQDAVDLSE